MRALLTLLLRNRWLRLAILAAVPVVLALVLLERRSWLPRILDHNDYVRQVIFSRDGNTLISVTSTFNQVNFWNVKQESLIRKLKFNEDKVSELRISPDGETIAGFEDGEYPSEKITLWDTQNGKLRRSLKPSDGLRSFSFSPDSRLLEHG